MSSKPGATVHTIQLLNRKSFTATAGSSILDAASAAGINLEHSCRNGRCGSCRTQVIEGSTRTLQPEAGLKPTERDAGWILSCARSATSDLRLGVQDLGNLAGIEKRILPARIDRLELLAEDVIQVMLRLPPNAKFKYLSGQHIAVIARDGTRRSYSIANADEGSGKLELHIRRVAGGALSGYWFDEARTNDLLRFEGPLGTFFLRQIEPGQDLIFLATGTGIAPIKAMLDELRQRPEHQRPRSIGLLWGGRRQQDLYWTPDLPGLKYSPVLSRPRASWQGAVGHVQNVLLQQGSELSNSVVYACGSLAMTDSARAALAAAGLPAGRFHADAFVSSAAIELPELACH